MRDEIYYVDRVGIAKENNMAYPDFTLSYGATSVTLGNQNIISWSRAMIEPDANDLYKGIPVRINGNVLYRWSLSLIVGADDTALIKTIYREATRDRFNKGLPTTFDVTLLDNAEVRNQSSEHKVLIATCTPKPISCDRYEIELELIQSPDYLYVPTFSIGGVTFNQSEITSYDPAAVVSEGEPNLWEWSLGLILDADKMTALANVYNAQVLGKSTPPYTGWGVLVDDNVGAAPVGIKAEIMSFSHTVSVRGFEVRITLSALRPDADSEALTFTIGNVVFAGKEINSSPITPLVTRSIDIIPTGSTVVKDNCGGPVRTWSCDFESTKTKCLAVVDMCENQRVIQLIEGSDWLVPVVDGVNGKSGLCAIDSARMDAIREKPGKYSLQVDLRQVNT